MSTLKTAISKLKVPRRTHHEVWFQQDDGRYLNRSVSPELVLTAAEIKARATKIEADQRINQTVIFVDFVTMASPVPLARLAEVEP